jgi:hypothetical protein
MLATVASDNRARGAVRDLVHSKLSVSQIGTRLRGGSDAVGDSDAGEQDVFRPTAFDDDPGSIVREDQSDEEETAEEGLEDEDEEAQGRGRGDVNDMNAMLDEYWREKVGDLPRAMF